MEPAGPGVREFAELAETLHAAPTPTRTAEEVVAYARRHLDADHGSITLLRRRGRLQTVAASDPAATLADAYQAELGEGPCRDRCWPSDTVVCADLATDLRWPRWGPRLAALGIAGLLATQLLDSDGHRIGSVNMFWNTPRRFTADDVAFANIFTRHAAVALSSSMVQEGLNVALDARKLIGQAQGILMERHGLDETTAFEVLNRYSQEHNMKLRRVAEYLVTTRNLPRRRGRAAHRLVDDTIPLPRRKPAARAPLEGSQPNR